MNDRNRGGMSISTLLTWGLVASLAIPIICLVAIGIIGSKNASGGSSDTLLLTIGCVAVSLLVGGIATYVVHRRIQERLLSLVDVCRNFSGGDRSMRAAVGGDDELSMLALSLNSLLDTQSFSGGSGSSSSLPGSSDAAALQAQIEKLLQEVSAVGDGDLRVQAEVTPDTLGVLADSFNYMIEELAKVVGRVQNTAVQVTNASRRVLDRSAELAQASETQVARISQTTQAVEALASFVQNVAHNAQLSADSAREALVNAKTGQMAVSQTIDEMIQIRENVQETSKKIKRLGERSNEIGEIVRLIEDIADQTNLLALNAAIQSAMAGEHGRGFAVVADEIRLLAERSTESTKRIATLVKSIQGDTYEAVVAMEDSTQEVVKGSQLADEAGRALNSIYTAVERQTRTIEAIAQAANEQASVSEDVANAMTEISEITNRTNSGTQEAAMSVSYLAELSDQLRASVSTFRLPERASEGVEVFPSMGGVPALGSGMEGEEQFYQQDMSLNGDWNQNFSADFLSLPQPQETEAAGSFQFAFQGQDEFSDLSGGFGNQGPFGSQPGFANQPFGNQFGNQNSFGNQAGFGNGNQAGFAGVPQLPPTQSGFDAAPFPGFTPGFAGQSGGFDAQGFDDQGFQGIPESGYGQQNAAPLFSFSSQMPAVPQQNFPPSQGNVPARPRWPNPSAGQGQRPFSQDQVPFPGNGNNNGHLGQ